MKENYRRIFNTRSSTLFRGAMILLFLLAALRPAGAQIIDVPAGYPKFDADAIVTLEDERTLFIQFAPDDNDLTQAKVTVELPDGITLVSAGSMAAFPGAPVPTVTHTLVGKLLTIDVTSDGGTLAKKKTYQFVVKVKAECRQEGNVVFPIKILSGTDQKKALSAGINVAHPDLTLRAPNTIISYGGSPTTPKEITYYLRTTTASEASSAKVDFIVDESVTLSDFKLNGVAFTPTVSPLLGERHMYSYAFTSPTAMGGSKIKNNNDKRITFKAAGTATICGQKVIQASVQYPHNSPACGSAKFGTEVTLNMSTAGNPTFTKQGIQYVANPSSTTPIAPEAIPMDGVTPVYVKAVFKNDQTAAARSVKLQLLQSLFGYIDTANMYVQVDNGPVTKISASGISGPTYVPSNQGWGFVKDALKTKYYRIYRLTTPVTVPTGSTMSIYFASINGAIHDNGKKDVFNPVYFISINNPFIQLVEATGFCNNTNTTAINQQIQHFNSTHYQEKPALVTLKDQETKTVKVKVTPGSIKQAPAVLTVKTPSWLTITDIKLLPKDATFPPGITVTPIVGAHESSVRVTSTGNTQMITDCHLQVTYKAPTCGGDNKNDTIWYTAKQEWSGGHLNNVSQVSQPVQLSCVVEGVGIDTFYIHRGTRGYPDVNNDREPESSSLAHDSIITHTQYVPGDTGYFYWKGKIGTSGNYKYLDIPIEAAKTGGNGLFTIGAGDQFPINLNPSNGRKVTIDGKDTTLKVDYHYKNNEYREGYFRIHNSNGFPNGKEVEIKVPFEITKKVGNQALGKITSGFYVSENEIPDPYNSAYDSQKKGGDVREIRATISLIQYYVNPAPYATTVFKTRAPKLNAELATIAHQTTPEFDKEARFFAYPKKIIIELPLGYSLDDTLNIHRNNKNSTGNDVKKIISPESKVTNSDGTTKITWDLTNLYQTTDIAGTLTPGKWRLPDDTWIIYPKGTLKVNPSVDGFQDSASMFVSCVFWDPNTDQEYQNPYGSNWPRRYRNTLKYDFDVKLKSEPASATAYGPRVTGPSLEMRNNSSDTLKYVYYYFDGPIKNVSMKLLETGMEYLHTATTPNHNGCWVKVADLPNNKFHTYKLTYTDTVPQCGNHTVKVYAGSGFSGSWTPGTGTAYNPVGDPNFVEQTHFTITHSQDATIKGWIDLYNTAKADTVPEGSTMTPPQTYTMRATFSTASSNGMVKDLEMDLTVPKGQIYVPNSAQIEYPIGKFRSVPSTSNLEAVLATLAAAADSADGRPKTVRLKLNESGIDSIGTNFILPGGLSFTADSDSIYLQARLHMKFRAMCNTPFRGFQYFGKVYGKKICDSDAGGNGGNMPSRLIFPDVTFGYKFDLSVHTVTTSYAFNEGKRNDTLVLHINKYFGHTADMKLDDYLEVLMPPELNIDGDSIRYTTESLLMPTLNGKKDTVAENTTTATVRRLKLPFPVSEYNSESSKRGVGEDIYCHIPVVYTPNGQARAANPVDSVQARIWSELKFGDCAPVPTIFGEGKRDIGLFTAVEYPHIAWIGDTARFEITSHGFNGKWFKEKTGGTPLSSDNPWEHTPTDTSMVGDTVFYFSPLINGTEYGSPRLPYAVKLWVRPWFIKNLDTMKYICTEFDTLFVKAGGMDVKYQWHKDGTALPGATDTFLVVTQPGSYHVMVHDSVTPPNIIYSDTCEVYFREYPEIIKDLEDVHDCDNIYVPLAVKHTGRFMLYQWFRNGRPIPGARDSVYRASAYDSSSYYRVKVMNPCGDSVLSRHCYVDFCDAHLDGATRTVELLAPGTVETQPSTRVNQVTSRGNFVFTVHAKTGHSLRYMTITTDNPAWSEAGGSIERTMVSDSVMTVRVRIVNSNLRVYVDGITPMGIREADKGSSRAWTHMRRLYLSTDRKETVRIYTVMGHLYREQPLAAGVTIVDNLPAGFYLVRFSNGEVVKVHVE